MQAVHVPQFAKNIKKYWLYLLCRVHKSGIFSSCLSQNSWMLLLAINTRIPCVLLAFFVIRTHITYSHIRHWHVVTLTCSNVVGIVGSLDIFAWFIDRVWYSSHFLENGLIIVRPFPFFIGLCTRRAGIKIHGNQTFGIQILYLRILDLREEQTATHVACGH